MMTTMMTTMMMTTIMTTTTNDDNNGGGDCAPSFDIRNYIILWLTCDVADDLIKICFTHVQHIMCHKSQLQVTYTSISRILRQAEINNYRTISLVSCCSHSSVQIVRVKVGL